VEPHQPLGLEALQHPVDAGTAPPDELGQDALAQMDDTVVGPAEEDEGDLGLEPAGQQLDQAGLGAGHSGRHRQRPSPGELRTPGQEPVEGEGVDRQDSAVLEGDGIERLRRTEEQRNVAHHVTRPEDLHHDRPAVEGAGQLDGAAADDVDPAWRLARPEEEPAGVVLVLPQLGGQLRDLLRGERREVGPPDTAEMAGDPDGLLPRSFRHIPLNQAHRREYSPFSGKRTRRNLCSGREPRPDFTAVSLRHQAGDIGPRNTSR